MLAFGAGDSGSNPLGAMARMGASAREIRRLVLVLREVRLGRFDRMENLRGARYQVGNRAPEPSDALNDFAHEGDYYVRDLVGPQEVPALIRDLEAHGVRIREIREMDPPLEDLFSYGPLHVILSQLLRS